jgi:hypothetical protein
MLKAASHDNGGPTMTARTMVADKVPPVLKPVRDASLMRRQMSSQVVVAPRDCWRHTSARGALVAAM